MNTNYVLIIENDESIGQLLRVYISESGIVCLVAQTFAEAEPILLKHGKPIIVFLDYIYIAKDINEVVERLRQHHADIQICLFTAAPDPEEIVSRLNLFGLLKKPFSIEQLDEIISKVF